MSIIYYLLRLYLKWNRTKKYKQKFLKKYKKTKKYKYKHTIQ